jgi:hypothetical protein
MVSFTPWLLYLRRKAPWYLFSRKLGRIQSGSEGGGEEEKRRMEKIESNAMKIQSRLKSLP